MKLKDKIVFLKDVAVTAALLILTQVTAAYAQLPWDSTLSTVESDMTGTVAKILSVVAVVIAGVGFAHSEDGSWKKTGFKVALGVTIAMAAASWVNVL
jgi:type IV secretory pathway VirB2 component (pilin)